MQLSVRYFSFCSGSSVKMANQIDNVDIDYNLENEMDNILTFDDIGEVLEGLPARGQELIEMKLIEWERQTANAAKEKRDKFKGLEKTKPKDKGAENATRKVKGFKVTEKRKKGTKDAENRKDSKLEKTKKKWNPKNELDWRHLDEDLLKDRVSSDEIRSLKEDYEALVNYTERFSDKSCFVKNVQLSEEYDKLDIRPKNKKEAEPGNEKTRTDSVKVDMNEANEKQSAGDKDQVIQILNEVDRIRALGRIHQEKLQLHPETSDPEMEKEIKEQIQDFKNLLYQIYKTGDSLLEFCKNEVEICSNQFEEAKQELQKNMEQFKLDEAEKRDFEKGVEDFEPADTESPKHDDDTDLNQNDAKFSSLDQNNAKSPDLNKETNASITNLWGSWKHSCIRERVSFKLLSSLTRFHGARRCF